MLTTFPSRLLSIAILQMMQLICSAKKTRQNASNLKNQTQQCTWTTTAESFGHSCQQTSHANSSVCLVFPRIPRWAEKYFLCVSDPQICTHRILLYFEKRGSYITLKLELFLHTEFNSKDIITKLIKYLSSLTDCDLECHTATVLNSTISALLFQVNCMTD